MWKELQIRRYLWEVSLELPGSRKQKKTLLRQVENSVREFVSERPGVDYADIVKWFGVPQKIAESYVSEMEASELLEEMNVRRKVVHILLASVTIIVLIWFGFTATAYYSHLKNENGYAVIEVNEIERVEQQGGN